MTKPIALQNCEAGNHDFSYGFRYQYVVGPDQLSLPGFTTTSVGSQWVHAGKDLRSAKLVDGKGKEFGISLGIAVDHYGNLPEEVLPDLVQDASAREAIDELEAYLPFVSGRYALIVKLNERTYFYCDPVGSIGAVTARETRRVGASPGLCVDRPFVPPSLYDNEAIAEGHGTYGLSHTCDRHVFRHNANHRLDLDGFSSQRFWPPQGESFSAPKEEYGEVYDEIISASRKIIGRMTQLGDTSLPLSGGNDSRIVLALTDDETRGRLSQVFSHINTYANRRDAEVAAVQCAAAGVRHEVHDKKKTKVPRFKVRPYIHLYKEASAMPGAVPKEIHNGLFMSVREGSIVMRGHQCNILRGQYITTNRPEKWKSPGWQIRIMKLVGSGRFNKEVANRFTPDFMSYYRDLPENALERSADFIFFETLVPAALGPLFSGQSHAFYLSPFNSRRLVQLFMQPDIAYRRTNATTHDLILRADPALFSLPYEYDLPANLNDDEASFKKREKRCEKTAKRYEDFFGEAAPDYDTEPFNV